MNPIDDLLRIQSTLDDEADDADRHAALRQVSNDPEAALVQKSLKRIRQILRDNEPRHSVPVSREFYFSAIQRRIAAESPAPQTPPARTPSVSILGILRWLAPALAAAVLLLVSARLGLPHLRSPRSEIFPEAENAAASGMVFRSESDGVTIHWIN